MRKCSQDIIMSRDTTSGSDIGGILASIDDIVQVEDESDTSFVSADAEVDNDVIETPHNRNFYKMRLKKLDDQIDRPRVWHPIGTSQNDLFKEVFLEDDQVQ